MKEEGKIIEVTSGGAVLEVAPDAVCTKCCSCSASKPRRVIVTGEKAEGLAAGDTVEIEIDTSSMMQLYMLLYGLPLVVFVGAVVLIYTLSNSPGVSFVGGFAGTIITYAAAGVYIRRTSGFCPDIRVIGKKGPVNEGQRTTSA